MKYIITVMKIVFELSVTSISQRCTLEMFFDWTKPYSLNFTLASHPFDHHQYYTAANYQMDNRLNNVRSRLKSGSTPAILVTLAIVTIKATPELYPDALIHYCIINVPLVMTNHCIPGNNFLPMKLPSIVTIC